jgi:hypothetical protein
MSFAGRSLPRLTGPAESVGRHFDADPILLPGGMMAKKSSTDAVEQEALFICQCCWPRSH